MQAKNSGLYGVIKVTGLILVSAIVAFVSAIGYAHLCIENKEVAENVENSAKVSVKIDNIRLVRQENGTPYIHVGIYKESEYETIEQINEIVSNICKNMQAGKSELFAVCKLVINNPVYVNKSPNIIIDSSVESLINDKYAKVVYDKTSNEIDVGGNKIEVYKYTRDVSINNFKGNEKGNIDNIADVVYSICIAYNEYYIRNILKFDDVEQGELDDISYKYLVGMLRVLKFIGRENESSRVATDYNRMYNAVLSGVIPSVVVYTTSSGKHALSSIVKDKMVVIGGEEYASMFSELISESPTYAYGLKISNSNVENNTEIDREFSRINLIKTACKLVGNVRYVWGGGHGEASNIHGINPLWSRFNSMYIVAGNSLFCIQPDGSWCPFDGSNTNCWCKKQNVSSIDELIDAWNADVRDAGYNSVVYNINNSEMQSVVYKNTFGTTNIHRFVGLDCSGYVNWVYNQIGSSEHYDSSAAGMSRYSSLQTLEYGSSLCAGDIISWSEHVELVVGKFDNNCYITIEQTPNTVKFGACSMLGGNQSLKEAIAYANELNREFGIDTDEEKAVGYDFEIYNASSLILCRSMYLFSDSRKYAEYMKDRSDMTLEDIQYTEEMSVIDIMNTVMKNGYR